MMEEINSLSLLVIIVPLGKDRCGAHLLFC